MDVKIIDYYNIKYLERDCIELAMYIKQLIVYIRTYFQIARLKHIHVTNDKIFVKKKKSKIILK